VCTVGDACFHSSFTKERDARASEGGKGGAGGQIRKSLFSLRVRRRADRQVRARAKAASQCELVSF